MQPLVNSDHQLDSILPRALISLSRLVPSKTNSVGGDKMKMKAPGGVKSKVAALAAQLLTVLCLLDNYHFHFFLGRW